MMLKFLRKVLTTKKTYTPPVIEKDEDDMDDEIDMLSSISYSDRRTYDPYSSGNPYRYNPGDKSSFGQLMRDISVVDPLIDDDNIDPFYYDDLDI